MEESNDGLIYLCGGEIDAGEFSVEIWSENLNPDLITGLLGKPPTESHRRGDTFGPRAREYSYGQWATRTGRLDFRNGKSCEESFDDFVRSLPGDETVWRQLSSEHETRMLIVLRMRTWNREFDLSPFALGELARRQLKLHIDTYLEVDEDEAAEE